MKAAVLKFSFLALLSGLALRALFPALFLTAVAVESADLASKTYQQVKNAAAVEEAGAILAGTISFGATESAALQAGKQKQQPLNPMDAATAVTALLAGFCTAPDFFKLGKALAAAVQSGGMPEASRVLCEVNCISPEMGTEIWIAMGFPAAQFKCGGN